jgi:hypothetical protein
MKIAEAQDGWRNVVAQAFRNGILYLLYPQLWPIMTDIAANVCRPICCRPSVIISGRTPTKEWTSPEVSSSIPLDRPGGDTVATTYVV